MLADKKNPVRVVIISTRLDLETDSVIRCLSESDVQCHRLNSEDFPFDAALTISFPAGDTPPVISYKGPDRPIIGFAGISSIWYRRVRAPERPDRMEAGVYDFCLRESRSALFGAILSQGARIMSPPAYIWSAEFKPFQLNIARRAGMLIPDTIVTNDPVEIRSFFTHCDGAMIAKPVRTGYIDYGLEQHAIYTSRVLEKHLECVESARWSPAIYQPLIDKISDIRVTVVGKEIFAVEIDSQKDPDARIDWRHTSDSSLPHRRIQLPSSVRACLARMMSTLGLDFGAIDLLRAHDNEYIFLEVNPNGQWLWLDAQLNLGISKAVAGWLSRNTL